MAYFEVESYPRVALLFPAASGRSHLGLSGARSTPGQSANQGSSSHLGRPVSPTGLARSGCGGPGAGSVPRRRDTIDARGDYSHRIFECTKTPSCQTYGFGTATGDGRCVRRMWREVSPKKKSCPVGALHIPSVSGKDARGKPVSSWGGTAALPGSGTLGAVQRGTRSAPPTRKVEVTLWTRDDVLVWMGFLSILPVPPSTLSPTCVSPTHTLSADTSHLRKPDHSRWYVALGPRKREKLDLLKCHRPGFIRVIRNALPCTRIKLATYLSPRTRTESEK